MRYAFLLFIVIAFTITVALVLHFIFVKDGEKYSYIKHDHPYEFRYQMNLLRKKRAMKGHGYGCGDAVTQGDCKRRGCNWCSTYGTYGVDKCTPYKMCHDNRGLIYEKTV